MRREGSGVSWRAGDGHDHRLRGVSLLGSTLRLIATL
jgi:hypothetical protein